MIPSIESDIDDDSHHDDYDLPHIDDKRQDAQPWQATGHIYGSAFPPAYQRARHTQLQRLDGDGNDVDSESEYDGDKALIIGWDPKYLWDGEFWRNMGV